MISCMWQTDKCVQWKTLQMVSTRMRLGAPYAPLRLRLQRAGQPPEKELIRMRLKMATQIGEGIPSVKIRVRRFG